METNYYLGIDVGGTKTEVAIMDEMGQVWGRGLSEGGNLHNCLFGDMIGNIEEAIRQAKIDLAETIGDPFVILGHVLRSGCIGLAGLDTRLDKSRIEDYLQNKDEMWGLRELYLVNDGVVALRSGIEENRGVCLISGTGANCYGICDDKEAKAGDWGYVLGDQGSGYALGRKILQQAMKEYDGREVNKLSMRVMDILGLSSLEELFEYVYRDEKGRVDEVASLGQIVYEADYKEDTFVKLVVGEMIDELVLAYRTVVKRLELSGKFGVKLAGGMLRVNDYIVEELKNRIIEVTAEVSFVDLGVSPAWGAAKIARNPNLGGKNMIKKEFVTG